MQNDSSTFALVLLFCGSASAVAPVVEPVLARAGYSVQATIEHALDEPSRHCRDMNCARLALLKVALQSTQCKPIAPAIALSNSLFSTWKGMPTVECKA